MDAKTLKEVVDNLFTKRSQFMVLCQEIAENFYPERADFTVRREVGDEFASGLMTSYPILCRRDLGDQLGSMLRPTAKEWFKIAPADPDRENNDARKWLERAAKIQRKIMYQKKSQFTRATKEGDSDFAAFGQCVISVRPNKNFDGLLYRNWHLRDVVWKENEEGGLGLIGRRWKPTARDLVILFGGKAHEKIHRANEKTPYVEFEVYHIICDADMYSDNPKGKPYWSIYYDCLNEHIMEAVPVWNQEYVIPRWQTVSGSQYAYSPATITALPDARLIQAMTYALLEAGEKAVNPPIVATQNVVRSDVSLYAGGITWVSEEYDERLGDALRPMTQDLRGLPFGQEQANDARVMINQAFYLNKLTLPQRAPEMTAYEVGQRIQEYIRSATPLFEPMEFEYNGGMCDMTFDILLRAGAFGPMQDIPESLSNTELNFTFESPLHDAIEQQKGQKFLEAHTLLADAVTIDQDAAMILDFKAALRDSLQGVGVPATWIRNEDETNKMVAQAQQQRDQQQMLANLEQGAKAAQSISSANAQTAGVQ